MKFDLPPLRYDRGHEIERNRRSERADAENHKKGRDIEVGREARVVLTASNGKRFALVVSTAGALSTVAL